MAKKKYKFFCLVEIIEIFIFTSELCSCKDCSSTIIKFNYKHFKYKFIVFHLFIIIFTLKIVTTRFNL